jgi:hypothetical protein
MNSYVVALLLTILIEVSVALVFGYRSKREIFSVLLVNLITEPVLNYLLLINSYFSLVSASILFILLLESVVILVEWRLLAYALDGDSKRLFVLSLVMNLASLVVGLLLFM